MIQKSYQILPYHMLIILTSKNLYLFTIGLDILKKLQTQTMAIASESDRKKHLMSFPPERIGHVAVCNDKYMIVWGGYNVSTTYIDTVSQSHVEF